MALGADTGAVLTAAALAVGPRVIDFCGGTVSFLVGLLEIKGSDDRLIGPNQIHPVGVRVQS